MPIDEIVRFVAPLIAFVGAIVGLTRYVTQLQLKPHLEQLENDAAHFKEKIESEQARTSEVQEKYERLLQDLAAARRVGTAALVKKAAIDDDLQAAAETLQATAWSLFVRSPSLVPGQSQAQEDLIFLSISGPAATKLRRTRIPIRDSIAGQVLTSGKSHLTTDAHRDPSFYDRADQLSKYKTEDMLACPVKFKGETIAVAQFLNKKGASGFQPDDVRLAELCVPSLAAKVGDFIQSADNFEILGITLEREAEVATVMFCDLTNSSSLFSTLLAPVATDLINAYLEMATDVVIAHGATVDQFLGDGVMVRLNVPRRVYGHEEKAVRAAFELQRRFDELKAQWTAASYPVGTIFSRIGIASGPVHQVSIGHPQYQHPTLMGPIVSLANALCEAGPRDRSAIVVDHKTYGLAGSLGTPDPIPSARLGKAARFAAQAYVVTNKA